MKVRVKAKSINKHNHKKKYLSKLHFNVFSIAVSSLLNVRSTLFLSLICIALVVQGLLVYSAERTPSQSMIRENVPKNEFGFFSPHIPLIIRSEIDLLGRAKQAQCFASEKNHSFNCKYGKCI